MPYGSFEDLEVWKEARSLKKEIIELVKTFPPEEKFRLIDQIKISSRSVGTQIAEGHGRRTKPDELRFCVIGRGSLSETLNHFIDAFDEGYITEEQLNAYKIDIIKIEKLLNGYMAWLERSKEG
jgi:four helix bundle protein